VLFSGPFAESDGEGNRVIPTQPSSVQGLLWDSGVALAHADKLVQVGFVPFAGFAFAVHSSPVVPDVQDYSTTEGWSQVPGVRSSNWSLSDQYIDLSTAAGQTSASNEASW